MLKLSLCSFGTLALVRYVSNTNSCRGFVKNMSIYAFIAYTVVVFYRYKFGLVAFSLIGAPISVVQAFPSFCVWFFHLHKSKEIFMQISVLLLDQQVKVNVFTAIKYESDVFFLATHEEGKGMVFLASANFNIFGKLS